MNKFKLKEASEKLKKGDRIGALKIYQEIKDNTDSSRRNFISSLDFMLDYLSKSSQEEAQYGLSGFNDGENNTERSNVILLINPSHAHDLENEFWVNFIKAAKKNGFEVVEIAFRNVTPFSDNITLVNPARAIDLARKYDNLANHPSPKWFSEKTLNHYSDWEHRRWQIAKYHSKVKEGILNTAKFIDEIVKKLNPSMIITTNKIDWPNNFGFRAAMYYGIDYFFIERSPLDSHIIENIGMFSESKRAERLIFERIGSPDKVSIHEGLSLIKRLTANPYGFRADEAIKNPLPLLDEDKKVFFLPLDNIIWTGWGMELGEQGDIDYPVYKTPLEALSRISKEVVGLGGQLVVKPHPSCKEWSRLSQELPEIIFCNSDLQDLVKKADVVVTFLTKVTYVALAYNKPVVSFGGGLLDNMGITYQVDNDYKLQEQLKFALEHIGLRRKLARFIQILPSLNRTFFECGYSAFYFMQNNLLTSKIHKIKNITNLLSNIQKSKNKTASSDLNNSSIEIDYFKPTVLFDVSRLTSGAMWNSGISRYARALVRGLKRSRLFNVVCAANFANNEYGLSSYYLTKLETELNIDVVDINSAFSFLESLNRKYIYHSPVNPEQLELIHPNALKVITIHDILHVTQSEFYEAANTITPRIINAVKPDSTGVVFDSSFSQQDFENYIGKSVKKSKVVHLGVDDAFLETDGYSIKSEVTRICNFKADKLVIPFQGDPRKGFKRMLNIACDWHSNSPETRMVIVFGSSRNKARYNETKENFKASFRGALHYIENTTDEELAYIYRNCSATMYLSEAEGFGLPPLEAMACGCPCITLSNTSLTEVYEGWSLRLNNNAKDIDVLNILEKLTEDKHYTGSLRYEAIQFANRYKWSKTVEETMDFYNGLLKECMLAK